MILRLMVRMGASAPLLLSGLRRPLWGRGGRRPEDPTRRSDRSRRGTDAAATNRGRTACGHTRQTTTRHTMLSQRREHTLRERNNADVRHGELFLGAVPPNPHILALRARFRTRDAVTRTFPTFFPSFTSKNTRPPARNRPPEGRRQCTTFGQFTHFFPEKNFIWTLSEKNFWRTTFFCDIIFFRDC